MRFFCATTAKHLLPHAKKCENEGAKNNSQHEAVFASGPEEMRRGGGDGESLDSGGMARVDLDAALFVGSINVV